MTIKNIPELDSLPLPLCQPIDISSVFSFDNIAVAVNYYIYDSKRRTIVDFGSSRPCGKNHRRYSIHAEEKAIQYCRNNDKRNRFIIIISKFNKDGTHKYKECCYSCSQLAKKYKYQDKIFTINDKNELVKAMIDNPEISLAYKIKYGL